ncbi:hypothetical protein GCM10011335_23370 [Aureimonas glaciei]|uniref:DUF3489 domain-containing protein n=1 Tax=Aureimonas glaciei TaxID=1776957 RepID=A0A916XYJ4_9HYPH|nr:hypothetical protein GCM10011335_23370 [Aureimonas glaciei]
MKAHTVKSNAKRAARKLADRIPGLTPAEPWEAEGGGWWPAVDAETAEAADAARAEAYVRAEPVVALPKPAPVAPTKPKPTDLPAKPKPLAGADLMSAVRAIPPTRSSAEEIEARRAERRARVEEEKATGKRDRFGNKVDPEKVARGPSRAAIIVALVSRPGGALVDDILTATGWQRHTLRGYIAGTLRKRGHDIRSVKGKPARYMMGAA